MKLLKIRAAFTLIELMIAVAIIGIIAAIAIPAYQDYTIRAQATEGIVLASGIKSAVVDYYTTFGVMPPNHAAVGYSGATGNNVVSIEVSDGMIIATFSTQVHDQLIGKIIQLRPGINSTGGTINWTCASDANKRYLPTTCREDAI